MLKRRKPEPAQPPPSGAAGASEPVDPAPPAGAAAAPPLEVPRTKTSATYLGVGVGLVILVLVLDFIIQNLNDASVHFFTAHFRLPVGLLILIAAVAGGLIVWLVGVARVAQLRLMARRHRKAHSTA